MLREWLYVGALKFVLIISLLKLPLRFSSIFKKKKSTYNSEQAKLIQEEKKNLIQMINEISLQKSAIKKALIANIEKIILFDMELFQKAKLVFEIIRYANLEEASQILEGAHVIIEDGGALYERLSSFTSLRIQRISSHYKNGKSSPDLSVQAGEIFREVLIGKTNEGQSWFQLENHTTQGVKNFIAHGVDLIIYLVVKKNIGQYGWSQHTERNPIKIFESQKAQLPPSLNLSKRQA